MKRLRCTVSDKRGFSGDCMEVVPNGKYCLHSDMKKLEKKIDYLRKRLLSNGIHFKF